MNAVIECCPKCKKPAKDCRERGGAYACDVPTVWLVNEPLKRNFDGDLERWLPLGTLAAFGDVVRCLPDGSPPASLDGYLAILREKLDGWRDGDMLVCVGDQTLLVAAAMMIGAKTGGRGRMRVLKWERRQNSYAPVVLNFECDQK